MRVPQICLLATLTLTFFQQLSISVRAEDEVVCNEAEDVSDYRKYETGADVTWAQHRPLPAVPEIFPSERIKITVNGSVNTNRELYEVRECNWFGLHCWYEKRVRNNFVRPESIPLLWSLPEGSENGQISHSGATESPAVDWGDVPLTAARTLSAVVGSAANGINRLGCSGETPRCSVGAYNVTIEVDSGPRALRLLRDLSQTRLGYAAIQNENVLNSNLRASSLKVKACAAEGLLEQAKRFYGSAAGASERQKLLQEALNLNPTSKSAQTLLASTYLETGQFDEAKKTATVTAADNEKLIKAGRATAKTFVELAQNYATLAEVGWRETAGDSTKAALDAVGYLRLARDRLIDRLEKESRDLGELPEFSPDASRSLLTA